MDAVEFSADAEALCNRAALLIEVGRPEAARPLLAAVQVMAPPSPELTLVGARLAFRSGDKERAMQALDSGITEAPAHGGLRKCRAEMRQSMGDAEGAARDAAEAVLADPRDLHAKAILGATMLDLGRTADAVACLAEAVAGAPADIDFRQALAAALEKGGDTDTALDVLKDGIALRPASAAMRNAAILLCIRRRDFKRAADLAEKARSVGIADASTFGMKGHALSSLGQHDAAAIAYQDALKLGPEDPYVRHLVMSAGLMPGLDRAPEDYIRTVFEGYADRFEAHLISLQYRIPGAIREVLQAHPKILAGLSIGPVLDLGCGTGLVALATTDLPLGPFTGVDLSPRMLAHAQAKCIYAELREADIVADLVSDTQRWPVVVAADVVCYFGALEQLLSLVHKRLEPGGWFVFSVEELQPDRDGIMPGNGNWALQRQGRYAHTEEYLVEAVCAIGFRVLRADHTIIRQEAGADVPGLLLTIERIRHDG